jgi:enoyl-CoA hydratase/carnithine racemase
MMQPVLLVEHRDDVVTLTLHRPEKLNALSRELRARLVESFRRLQHDDSAGVVILTGAGRAFSAGLDLKELAEGGLQAEESDDYDVVGAMRDFERPIIGAINGAAVTGGFEIALACDFLIAAPEARFADTHARVGILPGWGLSQKLPRLIGIGRAKELSLTGNYLDAEQAERWGLVNRVVPSDELLPTCRELASDILSCVATVPAKIKRLIDDGYAGTFADGMRMERRRSNEHVRGVTPNAIADRRHSIQQRGRTQSR